MKSKTKYSLILFLLPILPCLLIGLYYLKLSLSESLRFEKDSVEYRLLTPTILQHFPSNAIGTIRYYYYSSADGPKPLINAIELESGKLKAEQEKIIANYFLQNRFTRSSGVSLNGMECKLQSDLVNRVIIAGMSALLCLSDMAAVTARSISRIMLFISLLADVYFI